METTKVVVASDGKEITLSNKPNPFGGKYYGYPVPVMDRDESRADTTIYVAGFRLSYDSMGYCYERAKDKSHRLTEAGL